MKVLSLFDGISCARVALERAGIKIEEYYASETDKFALQVAEKKYPDTIQLGDVARVGRYMSIEGNIDYILNKDDIDLLIGGSPCQDLSVAKRGRAGLSGAKSGLFWQYLRILKEVKPKYFILENVASMHERERAIITKELGVEPIMIDAMLVSAQDRKRLFWTNIPNIKQPAEKGLILRDIIEEGGEDITERMNKKVKGTLAYKKTWANVRTLDQRAKTLTASGQCLANSGATNIKLDNGRYKKLSPVECERLQGLPDGWTEEGWVDLPPKDENFATTIKVSDTQRYKMTGNAFNVDVITHILKNIK